MSKGKKAVIIIAAIVVVLAVAAGIILMPRHGKTVADTWSPYDTYGGQKWIRTIEKQPGKDFKFCRSPTRSSICCRAITKKRWN